MLSICVTVKNRSRVAIGGRELLLFPNCVASIASSVQAGLECELIVADWGSDDWPYDQWLDQAASPIPVRVVRLEGAFSRGRGLNAAADAAAGDVLLFLDADCLVSAEMIDAGLRHAANGKAFFPILYSFKDPEHTDGWWRDTGYGICVVPAVLYRRSPGWPEYIHWGHEDQDFHSAIAAVGDVIRERATGLLHQWHPNDFEWKNRFGTTANQEEIEIGRFRLLAEDLLRSIPAGARIISAGDSVLAKKALPEFKVRSFLERNGEYWGSPEDDAAAVSELERLRAEGAQFIVFEQSEFWWLKHYSDFVNHLHRSFFCVVASEQFVAFDLTASPSKPEMG